MNAPETLHASDAIAHGRAARSIAGRFQTQVTFEMPGATWEYVNRLHAMYRFHENWPAGMLCHITGEGASGICSIGLWRSRAIEQEYFHRVAVEVITASVHEIGPPPALADGENFEPRPTEITELIVTELCDAFADIGPDEDGDSINALGSQPVMVKREADAEEPFAIDTDAPAPGLIAAWRATGDDGAIDYEVWASAEHSGEPEALTLKRISFGLSELRG